MNDGKRRPFRTPGVFCYSPGAMPQAITFGPFGAGGWSGE